MAVAERAHEPASRSSERRRPSPPVGTLNWCRSGGAAGTREGVITFCSLRDRADVTHGAMPLRIVLEDVRVLLRHEGIDLGNPRAAWRRLLAGRCALCVAAPEASLLGLQVESWTARIAWPGACQGGSAPRSHTPSHPAPRGLWLWLARRLAAAAAGPTAPVS